MISRRDLIKTGAIVAVAAAVPSSVTIADPTPRQHKSSARTFWPDGIRMVVSVSMQMEGGAQPASEAESPSPRSIRGIPISQRANGTTTATNFMPNTRENGRITNSKTH